MHQINAHLRPHEDEPTNPERQVQELFLEHESALRRFVRRVVRQEEDTEDATQDTYMRMLRTAQAGKLRKEAKSYLFQSALNAARDILRRRRTENRYFTAEADLELLEDKGTTIDQRLSGEEALGVLSSSLQELDSFTRHVFLLYHVEHLSAPVIAERIGKTTRTVERHLAKALSHCTVAMSPFLKDE